MGGYLNTRSFAEYIRHLIADAFAEYTGHLIADVNC
jgi:hypothetical protein